MNEQKISFIERKMLHPHPENPRKDLGDLEELWRLMNGKPDIVGGGQRYDG